MLTGFRRRLGIARAAMMSGSLRGHRLVRLLPHYNVFVERGLVAQRIAGVLRGLIAGAVRAGGRWRTVLASRAGRAWFTSFLTISLREVLGDTGGAGERLRILEEELESLTRTKLAGEEFVHAATEKAKRVLGEGYAGLVDRVVKAAQTAIVESVWVGRDQSGETVVYDASLGRLYTSTSQVKVEVEDSKSYRKAVATLASYGIVLNGEDYYRLVNGKLMVKAVLSAGSAQGARELYTRMYMERLASDPDFASLHSEISRRELMRTYNAAAAMTLIQDLATKIPGSLVATLSRLLSRAVAAIPVVGSIATVHYEAAATITEVGDKLGDRLQTVAHMWYSLPESIRPHIAHAFTKQIQEAKQATETQKQTATTKQQ